MDFSKFGLKTKSQRQEDARKDGLKKIAEFMARYNLFDMKDSKYFSLLKRVSFNLTRADTIQKGIDDGLGIDKDYIKMQVYYQRALVEQNFIIIHQLNELINGNNHKDNNVQDSSQELSDLQKLLNIGEK